ncbi:MAG: pantoate--beta-alanine ligase [Actinomycetes bacterium]|jgi:pantoate--beta-alanine ligase
MLILRSIDELRSLRSQTTVASQTIGFVPTMGALHLGHSELLKASVAKADITVASIFINPMQFNSDADLEKYPRTVEEDLEICSQLNVNYVYLPQTSDIYPEAFDTSVTPGSLGSLFEGASRPGHFAGMATVVVKLFNIVQPDIAFFGKKDYQQLAIIRRFVADLNFPIDICAMETIREADGLALSSRNAQLTSDERQEAPRFHEILGAFAKGFLDTNSLNNAYAHALEELRSMKHFQIDYFDVADRETLKPSRDTCKPLVVLGAILGSQVRLIDNQEVQNSEI